jgi:FkbM family methyltransferase
MIKKLVIRARRFFKIRIVEAFKHNYFKKDKKTLIYLGLFYGASFSRLIHSYKICYGFEANPELYKIQKKKYKYYKNIHIIHAAVTDYNGMIKFNLSDNNGASSSIGEFKQEYSSNIKMVNIIDVPAILLSDFLRVKKIDLIDGYYSDIQGNDLNVLKTLSSFIKNKQILSITCETSKDKYNNIYNLGDNSESGFKELLEENYYLAAKGWEVLEDGKFIDVKEDWWEMDCRWKLKG